VSFLSAIVKVPGAIFHWLGSSKGQAIVQTAGAVAVAFGAPALVVQTAESWISKILTIEQIAESAGSQSGSGLQKSAAVIAAMTPEILAKFPDLPAENIQKANNALVDFLNALTMPVTPDAPVKITGA
jgi:hypothetical protein